MGEWFYFKENVFVPFSNRNCFNKQIKHVLYFINMFTLALITANMTFDFPLSVKIQGQSIWDIE